MPATVRDCARCQFQHRNRYHSNSRIAPGSNDRAMLKLHMNQIVVNLTQYTRWKIILALFVGEEILLAGVFQLLFLFEPDFITQLDALNVANFNSSPLINTYVIYIILIPFLETLVFQYFLLLKLRKFFIWATNSESWFSAFLLTSLIFSFAHTIHFGVNYYGLLYALLLIVPAFSLTILAAIELGRENGHPVLYVSILHGSHNLVAALVYTVLV